MPWIVPAAAVGRDAATSPRTVRPALRLVLPCVASKSWASVGRIGSTRPMIGGLFLHDQIVLIVVVIASGAFLGIVNTVLTEAVMASARVERPIASSAYSFVRFTGGAIAPFLAGKMAEHISPETPMLVGSAMVAASVFVLLARRSVLADRAHAVVAMPERPRQDSN